MGKVYLIGAGPGHEELITIKAVRILKKCTAVVYDRLAGEHVLKYVNDDCEIYYCGKEPGNHYKTQEEINEILIDLSKKGHIVGRIKGGDPFVFGRGGEEGEALYKQGIEFEVIPGITSAISVLNYGGIPITNRGYSKSFHVFTGRSANELDFDWEIISKLTGTLVFLMGLGNMEGIIGNLLSGGKDENTPCAVIMRGTGARQKNVIGTLEDICKKVREAGLCSPVIIVVGEVVRLSNILNWYENKPLFGVNVCVTRSKEQAAPLKEKLLDLGAEVTEINAIRIKPTTDELEGYINKLQEYQYIVVTSVNGVNIFFETLIGKNIDIRNIKGKVAVIGSATEKALKSYGIQADIKAEEFVGESLAKKLRGLVNPGDKILIPTSKSARDVLPVTLRNSGAAVDVVHIYEVVPGQVIETKGFDETDVVLYTSPSIVKNMIHIVGMDKLRGKRALAIGPITAKELERNQIDHMVSEEHSTEGMINTLLTIYQKSR